MTSSRVPPSVLSACRRLTRSGMAALGLWLASHGSAWADDALDVAPPPEMSAAPDDGDVWELRPVSPSGSISGGAKPAQTQNDDTGGFGINARLGHIASETIDSDESRTFIELTPFVTVDSLFVGGDFRFLRTNTGGYAGSGGAIVRRFIPSRNAIFGTNLFFDVDNTKGAQFQQVGFGFEWLSNRLDNRTNVYIPFGNDQKVLASGPIAGSESFLGNSLYFSRSTRQITAATGVDTMFTVPVPGRIFERINLEASAGAYYFAPNDGKIRDFGGPKLRLDATLFRRLAHMYVEATHDNFNDSLVSFGVDVNYWNRYDEAPRLGGNQFHRITEWTRRNWNIVTSPETKIDDGIIAFNPATGLPYVIEHVDSNATALPGDGTFERPYTTLQLAQINPPAPPGSLIYAHAGSVFNTPLVMNPNEIIVGEGATFSLALAGSPDTVLLPPTGKPGGRPVFDGISGTPVTLASNSTFAGFAIANTSVGPAILGSGITSAHLEDIEIQGVEAGHGIHFLNSAGLITMDQVNILHSNPADPASGVDLDSLRVEGGTATISYTNSRIDNTLGRSVRVVNAGGVLDMRTVTVNSRFTVTANGDQGVIVEDSSADVLFGPLILQRGTVDLLNITGDITFAAPVFSDNSGPNPENPNAFALHVDGSTGQIMFNPGAPLAINNQADYAIDLRRISGSIIFHDDITIDPAAGLGVFDGGLIWQQNSGDFVMNGTYTTEGLGAEAILIGDAGGALANLAGSTFTMNGQFSINNGSIFSNADIEILNDPSVVTFSGGEILGRAIKSGIQILNTSGAITFNGTTLMADDANRTPTFGAFSESVSIQFAAAPVVFDVLTIIDDPTPSTTPRVFVDNSDDITFNELNVSFDSIGTQTQQGQGVLIQNSGVITAHGGTINSIPDQVNGIGGQAIALIDNERINWTSDSISAGGAQTAIFVSGQPGHFVVRGAGGAGSGGTIRNSAQTTNVNDFGAIFDFTGEDVTDTANYVELHDMIFSGNETAIVATNINRFVLDNTTVTTTIVPNGIRFSDILNLTVQDSVISNNAGTQLFATIGINPTDETFVYRFTGNQFVDGLGSSNSSMIRVDNVSGGAGATLDLIVNNNGSPTSGFVGFVSNRNNPNIANPNLVDESSTFAVRWNGPVQQALFERNSFALIGGVGQEGVEFFNADPASPTTFTFRENSLTANEAADAIGVRFDSAGPANVSIIGNQTLNTPGTPFRGIQMNGLRAHAFDLTLRNAGNIVTLEDNAIQMFNDDAIGFNFPFIGGNTTLIANGNAINFNRNFTSTGPGERGFAFGPVAGTVNFQGNRNNRVEFAQPDGNSKAFPNPFIGSHVGTIIINNEHVPSGP